MKSLLTSTLFLVPLLASAFVSAATDCRDRIQQHICILPVRTDFTFPRSEKECLDQDPQRPQVVQAFEDAYDNLPKAMQNLFCTFPLIIVEKSSVGGYTNVLTKDGDWFQEMQVPAFDYRMSKKVDAIEFGVGLAIVLPNNGASQAPDELATTLDWQNYSAFKWTKKNDDVTIKAQNIPMLANKHVLNSGFFNTIAHEFGHALDYLNGVNRMQNPKDSKYVCAFSSMLRSVQSPDCEPLAGSWTALSWVNAAQSKLDDTTFKNRLDFWGYFAQNDPSNHLADSANYDRDMQELMQSNFVSGLAATQAYDDWAESISMYVTFLKVQGPVTLTIANTKSSYDLQKTVNSAGSPFAPKREYIEKFLARKDLNFPDAYPTTKK